jgi:hypothetical protein
MKLQNRLGREHFSKTFLCYKKVFSQLAPYWPMMSTPTKELPGSTITRLEVYGREGERQYL